MGKISLDEVKGIFYDIRDSLEDYGYIVGIAELNIVNLNVGIAGSSCIPFEKSFNNLFEAVGYDQEEFFKLALELLEEGHYYSSIEINPAVINTGNREIIISVMLHEFCHVMSDVQKDYMTKRFNNKVPENSGHTDIWFKRADEVSRAFGLSRPLQQFTAKDYAMEILANSEIFGSLECASCHSHIEFSNYELQGETLMIFDGMPCTECSTGHMHYTGRSDGYTTLALCYNRYGLLSKKLFKQVLMHIIPDVCIAVKKDDKQARLDFEAKAKKYLGSQLKVYSKEYAIVDFEEQTIKVLGGS
jgi:hypothetical protein